MRRQVITKKAATKKQTVKKEGPVLFWRRIISITLLFALVFQLFIQSNFFPKLIGAEGVAGGLIAGGMMLILYPALIVISGAAASYPIKQDRAVNFAAAIFVSMAINAFILFGVSEYQKTEANRQTEEYYEQYPQARGLLDPERPISIIKPWTGDKDIVSPLNIIVYSQPGGPKGEVVVKTDLGPSDGTILAEGTLKTEGLPAPDGRRIIYTGTIRFNKGDLSSAYLIVRGANGHTDIREIRF